MSAEPVISREEIAALARDAAAEYDRTKRVPMNPFPALSTAAMQFDVDFNRHAFGGEVSEEDGAIA